MMFVTIVDLKCSLYCKLRLKLSLLVISEVELEIAIKEMCPKLIWLKQREPLVIDI